MRDAERRQRRSLAARASSPRSSASIAKQEGMRLQPAHRECNPRSTLHRLCSRSSVGRDAGFLNRRLQVRVLPRARNHDPVVEQMRHRFPKAAYAGANPAGITTRSSVMQACDSTCTWCARHFFRWVKERMHNARRDEGGRSGNGSFADAAATSIRASSSSSSSTMPPCADSRPGIPNPGGQVQLLPEAPTRS